MRISGVLVDLGMLPVQNIAQVPKLAPEVLSAADLILQRHGTELWDDHRTRDFGLSAMSLFHFFIPPRRTTVKYVFIYKYIYIHTHTNT
jgi:hypothetical protein